MCASDKTDVHASATPVFFSKKPGAKPNDAKPHIERRGPPSHPYVCHRCSKPGKPKPFILVLHYKYTNAKTGHWIEECPTNGDEKFNHRPRFKRATGIPRSNLEVIEGDEDEEDEGLADGKRQTVMINELGQRVRARPDEVAWEQHKAKVDASKEKQDLVALDSEELQAQGLLCPIDKRAFVDPASAPCCGKTYCHECIENALLDSGLVCPGCETENIFVEALVPNSDVAAKLKAYEDAKKSKNEEPSSSRPSTASGASVKSVGDGDASKFLKVDSMTKPDSTPGTPADKSPKKRPAEAELPNDRTGRAPTSAEKSKTKSSKSPSRERESTLEPAVGSGGRSTPVDAPKGPAAERNAASSSDATAFPNMNFPIMDMNAMNAMNMNMNPMMMGMMPGFNPYMNPMMGGGMMGGMPNMNGMNGMNNNQQYPTGPSNFQNNRFGGRGMNINQPFNPGNNSSMRGAYNNNFGKHNNFGGQRFGVNQQFNNNNTNDGAYERAPVNGRARNHANREMRPAEYKEL